MHGFALHTTPREIDIDQVPGVADAVATERHVRARFNRTLASWASDLLIMRSRGMAYAEHSTGMTLSARSAAAA